MWISSGNSLYLQALGVDLLLENSSDGAASALSKSINTANKSFSNDNQKDYCQNSQSGMMYEHSTQSPGEDMLTLSQAVFPVKTFQSQEQERGSMEADLASGQKWQESSPSVSQNTALLKTVQGSFILDWKSFWKTSTRWGMMQDGVLSAQPMPERITKEKDSGLKLLPTLTICGNYNRVGASKNSGNGLFTALGLTPSIAWLEWFMGFPDGWSRLDRSQLALPDWSISLSPYSEKTKNRTKSIKGLGNAQVPAQAILAWILL